MATRQSEFFRYIRLFRQEEQDAGAGGSGLDRVSKYEGRGDGLRLILRSMSVSLWVCHREPSTVFKLVSREFDFRSPTAFSVSGVLKIGRVGRLILFRYKELSAWLGEF